MGLCYYNLLCTKTNTVHKNMWLDIQILNAHIKKINLKVLVDINLIINYNYNGTFIKKKQKTVFSSSSYHVKIQRKYKVSLQSIESPYQNPTMLVP